MESIRAIIHIDVDCFYAQVEILKNPSIANMPVGVLQNQTISTCNYIARERGLKKMTNQYDAKQICPDLIVIPQHMNDYRNASRQIFNEHFRYLVKGKTSPTASGSGEKENTVPEATQAQAPVTAPNSSSLTPSSSQPSTSKTYGIFENEDNFILEHCAIDECYLDVTKEVIHRIRHDTKTHDLLAKSTLLKLISRKSKKSTAGTSLKDSLDAMVSSSSSSSSSSSFKYENDENAFLVVAAQIAAEVRASIFDHLGYTTCAGISVNKLMAKIAAGMQKPNAQSIIFRSGIQDILNSLPIRKIPKVGSKIGKMLKEKLNIELVRHVHHIPDESLAPLFKSSPTFVQYLKNMCKGIDPSPVTSKGPAKSIGQELTFLPETQFPSLAEKYLQLAKLLHERIISDKQRNNRIPTQLVVRWYINSYGSGATSASTSIEFHDQMQHADLHKIAMNLLKKQLPAEFKVTRISLSVQSFKELSTKSVQNKTLDHFFGAASKKNNDMPPTTQGVTTTKLKTLPTKRNLNSTTTQQPLTKKQRQFI